MKEFCFSLVGFKTKVRFFFFVCQIVSLPQGCDRSNPAKTLLVTSATPAPDACKTVDGFISHSKTNVSNEKISSFKRVCENPGKYLPKCPDQERERKRERLLLVTMFDSSRRATLESKQTLHPYWKFENVYGEDESLPNLKF